MESERIMQTWARRRGWDERTQSMLVYAFLDELGMENLGLFDRYLAGTAAGEDEAVEEAKEP